MAKWSDSMPREIKRMAAELGLEVLSVEKTGKSHLKVGLRRPEDGETRTTFLARTPSDHRAVKNAKACMRHCFDDRYQRQPKREGAIK